MGLSPAALEQLSGNPAIGPVCEKAQKCHIPPSKTSVWRFWITSVSDAVAPREKKTGLIPIVQNFWNALRSTLEQTLQEFPASQLHVPNHSTTHHFKYTFTSRHENSDVLGSKYTAWRSFKASFQACACLITKCHSLKLFQSTHSWSKQRSPSNSSSQPSKSLGPQVLWSLYHDRLPQGCSTLLQQRSLSGPGLQSTARTLWHQHSSTARIGNFL